MCLTLDCTARTERMRPKGLQVTEYPIRAEQGARRRKHVAASGLPPDLP